MIVGTLPPPPGVTPNFVNPESHGYRVVIATAIMFPLATVILFLRIYTRVIIVRSVGSDDYAIVIAWTEFLPLLSDKGFVDWLRYYYHDVDQYCLGVHMWNVPLTTFSPHFLKLGVITGVFYGISFMCVKLSILLLYLRLSPIQPFRIAVWAVIVVTVAYSVLGSFEFLFNCQPIAKNWDITIQGGKCIDVAKILMTHGSINIATDVVMLILPVTLVWKLNVSMKQRVAIAGLFMTGTLVCIVSSIRLKTVMNLIRSPDFSWVGAENSVWSVIEVSFGIICACLASFKPFLRRHFPKVLGSTYKSETATPRFSTKTASTARNTIASEHELESRRKSGISRMSKQQTFDDIESLEDIPIGDEDPQDISDKNDVTTTLHARTPS